MELTAEQLVAIHSESPELLVRAAAGSGKTTVLVERYLKHVQEDGYRPDEILTVTFTRKAAAEMKSRIVKRLRALNLLDEAQIAETGPILTIHSFCERLLRENALAAGIDPEFRVGESNGPLARHLIQMAIRLAVTEVPEVDANAAEVVSLLTGRYEPNLPRSPHAFLLKKIGDLLSQVRGWGLPLSRLREIYETPESLAALYRERIMLDMPGIEPSKFPLEIKSFLASLGPLCEESGIKMPARIPKNVPTEPAVVELQETCGLMKIVIAAWEILSGLLQREQVMDFTELESKAVTLLSTNPSVQSRLRRQYRVVLVDEFQDVNPVQHELIQALEPERSMSVGDPQQSIYGFRQADSSLMVEREKVAPGAPLTKNHRSVPGIQSFVDHLFGMIWDEYHPMLAPSESIDFEDQRDFEGVEFWHMERPDYKIICDMIKELVAEGTRLKDIAVLLKSNFRLSVAAEELRKAGIDAHISGGERFYTVLEVRDLANCLFSLCNPNDDFALLATLRSPFAGLPMDELVLLASKKPVCESVKVYKALTDESQCLLDDFLLWFGELQMVADRIPAWELLSLVLARSPYYENIARRPNGRQMIANVRKLLAMAVAEPELSPVAFAELVRETQEIRHTESEASAVDSDADAVKVMTIHKSKGLEFDTVIAPELFRDILKKDIDTYIEARIGLIAVNYGSQRSCLGQWLEQRHRARERAEAERLLYVLMTRAGRRLCIGTHWNARNSSFAHLVASKTGYKKDRVPPGVRVRPEPGPRPV